MVATTVTEETKAVISPVFSRKFASIYWELSARISKDLSASISEETCQYFQGSSPVFLCRWRWGRGGRGGGRGGRWSCSCFSGSSVTTICDVM